MATHEQNIENLRSAVYGEQVRGSMIELFEEDYKLVKNGLGVGTDITSPSSSTEGYSDGNVYLNIETQDIWKLENEAWVKKGNMKGIQSIEYEPTTGDGQYNTLTITLTDGSEPIVCRIKNGETGNGIASITKTSTNVLVDTYTILFTDGTHTTFDVTNGKSIVNIAKTSTSGLVDTYTITYNDTTTTTFKVTNGKSIVNIAKTSTSGLVDTYTITFNDTTTTTFKVTNGIDGNRWFRGTEISGKAVSPTVYVNSGITDARPNDYYLNPSEGAVYYCVTGGDAATATWSYELTMSGGGGGGNLSDLGDVSLVSLQNGQFLKYNATTSKWENANITFADLTDSNISSPTEGQVLTYNGTKRKWENRRSVASWKGRTGAVVPASGDYNAAQVDYNNSNSGLNATKTQGAIDELTPKKIITSNDAFNPSKAYTAGEWFIHQGVLYEVITACTGVTPPNSTYYTVKTLHDLKSEIDAIHLWSSEPISATVGGLIFLYVNKSLKLATVTYNSEKNASDGNFTLPDWVIPAGNVYAAMVGIGYLRVSIGNTRGLISNSSPYTVGQIVFPIK